MTTRISRAVFAIVNTATLLGFATVGHAVDGVILIDQNRALAGNVTPGDAPGFPVSINQPGSYRLSGNLTVSGSVNAIEINASEVTLDLNGFAIVGPTVCTGTGLSCSPIGSGTGIVTPGAPSGVSVYNGSVRGMFQGIHLNGRANLIEKIRAQGNSDAGIVIGAGTVSNNVASGNGGIGIQVGEGTVIHNTSVDNANNGFLVSSGTVSHNTASNNLVNGIQVSDATVSYNKASDNGAFGLAFILTGGYTGNAMNGNGTLPVSGGVSLGGGNHNVCNGVPC